MYARRTYCQRCVLLCQALCVESNLWSYGGLVLHIPLRPSDYANSNEDVTNDEISTISSITLRIMRRNFRNNS